MFSNHDLQESNNTLPDANISPENRGPLEKDIPIGNHHFLGAMLVSGRVTSWEPKVPPPKATPPRNKALIRPY